MATAVPDTVAPLAGAVIRTTVGVGVAVGVRTTVGEPVGAAVGVAVAVLVAVLVGAAVPVAVGVAPPLLTVTVFDAVPSTVLVEEYAFAEIVCAPLVTVVEFQLKVEGGVEAK